MRACIQYRVSVLPHHVLLSSASLLLLATSLASTDRSLFPVGFQLEMDLVTSIIVIHETICVDLVVFLALFPHLATVAIAYDNSHYELHRPSNGNFQRSGRYRRS